METDSHKAHLHLAGIIVGLFQAFFSGAHLAHAPGTGMTHALCRDLVCKSFC